MSSPSATSGACSSGSNPATPASLEDVTLHPKQLAIVQKAVSILKKASALRTIAEEEYKDAVDFKTSLKLLAGDDSNLINIHTSRNSTYRYNTQHTGKNNVSTSSFSSVSPSHIPMSKKPSGTSNIIATEGGPLSPTRSDVIISDRVYTQATLTQTSFTEQVHTQDTTDAYLS